MGFLFSYLSSQPGLVAASADECLLLCGEGDVGGVGDGGDGDGGGGDGGGGDGGGGYRGDGDGGGLTIFLWFVKYPGFLPEVSQVTHSQLLKNPEEAKKG